LDGTIDPTSYIDETDDVESVSSNSNNSNGKHAFPLDEAGDDGASHEFSTSGVLYTNLVLTIAMI
jgi:hypothetical protein